MLLWVILSIVYYRKAHWIGLKADEFECVLVILLLVFMSARGSVNMVSAVAFGVRQNRQAPFVQS